MDRLLAISVLAIWISTVSLVGIWLVDDGIITLDFLDDFLKNYFLIENKIYSIDLSSSMSDLFVTYG